MDDRLRRSKVPVTFIRLPNVVEITGKARADDEFPRGRRSIKVYTGLRVERRGLCRCISWFGRAATAFDRGILGATLVVALQPDFFEG